jgi:hypothetical protein
MKRNKGSPSVLGGKMKQLHLNKYSATAILLFAAAVIFMYIALISNPRDITTSVFVISGMVCAMTGIFAMTFSAGEPVDPRLLGLLPSAGCINLCSAMQLLGISGNAYFLPPLVTGETYVIQFNPTTSYTGSERSAKGTFRETGPSGLITIPMCHPLIEDLKKRNALVIPEKEEELTVLIREIIEDVFKFAPRVSTIWNGSSVIITFHNSPFIDGCNIIKQGPLNCCTKNPCPISSLCGVLIAKGRDKVVTLDSCSILPSSRDIAIVISILP